MTYNAIQILLILGDDLSRVDRKAVLKGLAHLQNPDGRLAFDLPNKLKFRLVSRTYSLAVSSHMKTVTSVICDSFTVRVRSAPCYGIGVAWTKIDW